MSRHGEAGVWLTLVVAFVELLSGGGRAEPSAFKQDNTTSRCSERQGGRQPGRPSTYDADVLILVQGSLESQRVPCSGEDATLTGPQRLNSPGSTRERGSDSPIILLRCALQDPHARSRRSRARADSPVGRGRQTPIHPRANGGRNHGAATGSRRLPYRKHVALVLHRLESRRARLPSHRSVASGTYDFFRPLDTPPGTRGRSVLEARFRRWQTRGRS